MNLIKSIQDHPQLINYLINIYLVLKGVRQATLIETFNDDFKHDISANLRIIRNLIRSTDLKMIQESERRYLIANQAIIDEYLHSDNADQFLGHILGFYTCYTHDYSNASLNRVSILINITYINTDIELHTNLLGFFCELSKINLDELHAWAKHLSQTVSAVLNESSKAHFAVTYEINIIYSNSTYLNSINRHDFNFLQQQEANIINLFVNYYPSYKDDILLRLIQRIISERNEEMMDWLSEFFINCIMERNYMYADAEDVETLNKQFRKMYRNLE